MKRYGFPAVVLLALSCGDGGGDGGELAAGLAVEVVASGLSFPVHLAAPSGDPRVFVVEKGGRIRIIRDGQILATPFLDISDRVSSGSEQGLLSVAFHPGYSANGLFFVNYTDTQGDTQIVRYQVSGDPDVADPDSAATILSVAQPFSNHNGGLVAFGPDGMLYVGLGDGGGANDPQGNGQDASTLLGSMLRIDVDGGDPYAIPPDNPFVGDPSARPEIWAIGLRNPWRFSFDAGLIYIADVGQSRWEEIDVQPANAGGLNYGWNIREGFECLGSDPCPSEGLVMPALVYGHGEGCSVTGGHVYRGDAIPSVQGHYFYSDYCSGWLRSFRFAGGEATEHREWAVGPLGNVTSFGVDGAGELYILTSGGTVYRLVPQ